MVEAGRRSSASSTISSRARASRSCTRCDAAHGRRVAECGSEESQMQAPRGGGDFQDLSSSSGRRRDALALDSRSRPHTRFAHDVAGAADAACCAHRRHPREGTHACTRASVWACSPSLSRSLRALRRFVSAGLHAADRGDAACRADDALLAAGHGGRAAQAARLLRRVHQARRRRHGRGRREGAHARAGGRTRLHTH
eukprot:584417-Pleurochrysis_carterae.AAC.2